MLGTSSYSQAVSYSNNDSSSNQTDARAAKQKTRIPKVVMVQEASASLAIEISKNGRQFIIVPL